MSITDKTIESIELTIKTKDEVIMLKDGKLTITKIEPVVETDDDKYVVESPGTKFESKRWYKDGKLHRKGDKPAIEYKNGDKQWYINDQLHRDGDKPASINVNGPQVWYQYNQVHRDNDEPAVIFPDGDKRWYQNGELHRDNDKPTVINYKNGDLSSEHYYIKGKLIKTITYASK